MKYDEEKIDEATLALLYLVTWKEHGGARAWKGFDWDTLNRLHNKGLISDPKGKAKSIILTEQGEALSRAHFLKLFATASDNQEAKEQSMPFYVYENWTAENKAVIHRSTCGNCKDGRGCHQNPLGNKNGMWHGPFVSESKAHSAAELTGRTIKRHRCV